MAKTMNIKKWIIILICFIAFLGACSIFFSSYAKPTVRQEIKNPIFTIGDENYALALNDGKNVVKFGSLPFGIYSGGLAFPNQQAAILYLERMDKPKQGWNIYQLSGDFEQDTYVKEGQRYINKSLLVIPTGNIDEQ